MIRKVPHELIGGPFDGHHIGVQESGLADGSRLVFDARIFEVNAPIDRVYIPGLPSRDRSKAKYQYVKAGRRYIYDRKLMPLKRK